MAASHDPKLLAIDPTGCGCTECLIGEYRPLQDATDEDIRALFAGEIRDNTDEWWHVEQKSNWEDDGFQVWVNGRYVDLHRIPVPIPVEHYKITMSKDAFERIAYATTLGE